jgi:hypothetical protein
MALTQEQFMRLMAGVDLPNSDSVYGIDPLQGDPNDPTSQYLASYGSDYLDPALQNAAITGVYAQKPQYQSDDIFARQKFYAGLAQEQGKVGYQVQQDTLENTRKQQQLAMDEAAFHDVHGDPDAQMRFLQAKGFTPQMIVNMYEGAPDDATFEEMQKKIDDALSETDQYGTPITVHSPGGLAARERLYQTARQMSLQQQRDEADSLMGERWKGLSPNMRAKEIYMRQQNPTKNVAVAPTGDVYYGEDAEQQAQEAIKKVRAAQAKPRGEKMSLKEWDQQTTRKGVENNLRRAGIANPGTVLRTSIPVAGGMRFGGKRFGA